MFISSPLLLACYLLATGSSGGRGTGAGRATNRSNQRGRGNDGRGRRGSGMNKGRKRYNSDGAKKQGPSSDNVSDIRQEELSPLPPLTTPNGHRPLYFTCRHTYENTLIDEIHRYARQQGGSVSAMSPYPGLVRVEDEDGVIPTMYDPVYALQTMTGSVVVSAESIKGIAKEVINALLGDGKEDDTAIDEMSARQKEEFHKAPRGALTTHSLVPGMCKGQSKPVMQHRAEKIGEEIGKMMKKMYVAARKATVDDDGNTIEPSERWLLQMMLQSPNIAVASLTRCCKTEPHSYWPNYLHPLGLAKVDIEEKMPSSAYRKLMEGVTCMGISPLATTTVVDLGACPGGWTKAMRMKFGCNVVSVDRSEIDPTLMKDNMVQFIKGDAFTFEPTMVEQDRDCWMISDVIAYPERCTELLDRWRKGNWASHMVVTMKFQGNEPDLDELDKAVQVVKSHDYDCRVKHFFNNKNEVTFMVSERG